MSATAVNLLTGWSTGYTFYTHAAKADEVKQGKNYYLAIGPQLAYMSSICANISKLAETLTAGWTRTGIKLSSTIAPIASIPALLGIAAVQHDHYELGASFLKDEYGIPLPSTLGKSTIKALQFITNHSETIARVAMAVTSVALIAIGQHAFGGMVIATAAYQIIDSRGLIPRKISLFIEKNAPAVSLVISLASPSWLSRIVAGCIIAQYITVIRSHVHYTIDFFVRHLFLRSDSTTTPLYEIDRPLRQQRTLSYTDTLNILNGHDWQFKINPSHCSHFVEDSEKKWQENDNFDAFITLFDGINWSTNDCTLKKLALDDRFKDFIKDRFVTIEHPISYYISELAKEAKMTPRDFAAHWTREQLVLFVQMLKGEKRATGLQADLDDAISYSKKIIPLLQNTNNRVIVEDTLRILAIEGGNYCARGLKYATSDCFASLTQTDTPQNSYERKLLAALQRARESIIQNQYLQVLGENSPAAIRDDKHAFDLYRTYLSLGFYPLTAHERWEFGVINLAVSYLYRSSRTAALQTYKNQLLNIVAKQGVLEFSIFMATLINENSSLTNEQKEELVDRLTDGNETDLFRFMQLMLVMLGVLKKQ